MLATYTLHPLKEAVESLDCRLAVSKASKGLILSMSPRWQRAKAELRRPLGVEEYCRGVDVVAARALVWHMATCKPYIVYTPNPHPPATPRKYTYTSPAFTIATTSRERISYKIHLIGYNSASAPSGNLTYILWLIW